MCNAEYSPALPANVSCSSCRLFCFLFCVSLVFLHLQIEISSLYFAAFVSNHVIGKSLWGNDSSPHLKDYTLCNESGGASQLSC
eukprot:m.113192 g.113192  ORF g.113192 m.113192 type:complete len:84 (-) comp15353_c0_seq1:466-717(-)